ncbi:uncharacterized protein E5676_scaffold629G00910 [Cucumis melo var. makuwa]|uniref:Uncharacterized protein n=1 Tax=Cucumis melo var. makuwa TaxID=1194695 RepID=A0A5D3DYL2_CUCMM|nr:uncharacterized protein E5676_scaffold629G00910 [Cucumis melo var. makuwa]
MLDNGSLFSSVQGFCSVCLRLEHDAIFDFQDPLKNGVLAVQTIRNNIMASTLLATTAITLSSLIGVFVSSSSDMSNAKLHLIYGNKSALCTSIKYFSILLCFLVAFLCNVQSIRYYAHVSFLATVPTWRDQKESIQYVARNLNRGSHFCRSLKEDQEVDLESPRQAPVDDSKESRHIFIVLPLQFTQLPNMAKCSHSGFVVDNSVPQYTAASFGRANKMALTIPYSGALIVFGLNMGNSNENF